MEIGTFQPFNFSTFQLRPPFGRVAAPAAPIGALADHCKPRLFVNRGRRQIFCTCLSHVPLLPAFPSAPLTPNSQISRAREKCQVFNLIQFSPFSPFSRNSSFFQVSRFCRASIERNRICLLGRQMPRLDCFVYAAFNLILCGFPHHGSHFRRFSTPWKQVLKKVPRHGSKFRPFSTPWNKVFHGVEPPLQRPFRVGEGRAFASAPASARRFLPLYDCPATAQSPPSCRATHRSRSARRLSRTC